MDDKKSHWMLVVVIAVLAVLGALFLAKLYNTPPEELASPADNTPSELDQELLLE